MECLKNYYGMILLSIFMVVGICGSTVAVDYATQNLAATVGLMANDAHVDYFQHVDLIEAHCHLE